NQAACFVIPDTIDQGLPNGFGVWFGYRLTGRRLLVDISDEPLRRGLITNRNKTVSAPSGGGKTYLLLSMVNAFFSQGSHAVIVDMGDGYRRLVEYLGGVYVAYTDETPICLNPFRLEEGETLPDLGKM